jgi:hypothetical protein
MNVALNVFSTQRSIRKAISEVALECMPIVACDMFSQYSVAKPSGPFRFAYVHELATNQKGIYARSGRRISFADAMRLCENQRFDGS